MTADRQFTGNNGPFVIRLCLQGVCNAANDDLGRTYRQRANPCHPLAQPLDKQLSVRVEHDFNDIVVFECRADHISERLTQFAD